MKPFNLEEYLKNPSQKIVTRDGSKARIICTDAKTEYPVIALVERSSGAYEEAISYTRGGHYLSYESSRVNDLFFAPEKHEGWFNIYHSDKSGFYIRQNNPYKSKYEADVVAKANHRTFFATVKVEWEE